MFLNSRINSWLLLIFSGMKSTSGGHICQYLCLNLPALFNSINLHLHETSKTQSHGHTLDFVIFQNFYFSKIFGNIVLPLPFTTIPQPCLIASFSNESVLRRGWPKYWSFSFSTSPSNEYSGLICFRIDWFDLAVQGTLKSLLQHHGLKTLQPNSLVCT